MVVGFFIFRERRDTTSEKLDDLQAQRDETIRQRDIFQHEADRLEQRVKYQRSARDRKRTHRLIQYGVVFEGRYRELSDLSDEEIYSMVEEILTLPEAQQIVGKAIKDHREGGD